VEIYEAFIIYKKEAKTMKKILFFTVILGIIGIGLAVSGYAQPIRVGAVINLTGPASSFGVYHAKGHQDYFRFVNEVKGGVVGRKLELILVDHAYKIPEGIKFVKKFCEEKVDMISTWDHCCPK
jgi:branched-chain amino acid transport system substrate-binding protein